MRKSLLLFPFWAFPLLLITLFSCINPPSVIEEEEGEEYENLQDRYTQLFEQMKDPATGTVPNNRLIAANRYTRQQQRSAAQNRIMASLQWEERGPIYDAVGSSNGNKRGTTNSAYTAGVVQTVLVDLAHDPTGNIAYAGSPAGGLWKCTNLASTSDPLWMPVNDFQSNLAIASICQDPTNPNVMYIATGDANTRDVMGYGIWKSTDGGTTWNVLSGTTSFTLAFKILCDASGNVYVAKGGKGLQRSLDGGATWQRITAKTLAVSGTNLTNPSYVTDIEISSTGRLHAAVGYYGSACQHYYSDNPTTVDSTMWNASTGMATLTTCSRIELACQGSVLYSVLGNTSYNIDYCYKSIDGGATWTKQNATAYTTSLGSGQGWYAVTLQIDPDNANNFIVGGLDAYKSTNSGSTITKITNWVTSDPYVHADHHTMQWYKVGSESRVFVGCDGGVFTSADAGVSWKDRNKNLGIKTFYSCSINPTAGSNYMIAGAQDNGVHQLKNAGLSWSTEVTGGDGAYVHINQQNTQVQYGTYVYNQYRRSTDGGNTWSQVNFSSSTGYFINPFDYDDNNNTLYASDGNSSTPNNQIRRCLNMNTASATSSTVITVSALARGGTAANATAFKVSPYTSNRVYVGSSKGSFVRMDNANGTPTYTTLTSASFPTGYINCINTGTSDNVLVATFTNYGVNNVWISTDAGANWTAIDGNLPDMPVWWAVFEPGSNDRLILGTESGVWSTTAVNGSSTVWTASSNFPIVRTNMLTVRNSDNTIVAATYGRGLYSAVIPTVTTPDIRFQTNAASNSEKGTVNSGCRSYKDYTYNMVIANPPTGDAIVSLNVQAGGTAKQGVDFDISTNGSFTTPSTSFTFTNGAIASKTFTVRVYDNASVDGNKSFTLGYGISGTTNAQPGTTNQTFSYTISDDDVLPTAGYTSDFIVGSSNSASDAYSPFFSSAKKNRVQYLISASELSGAGVDPGKSITAIAFNVTAKNSTVAYSNYTISLVNSALSALGSSFVESGLQTVYSGSYTTKTGLNQLTFGSSFTWDGTSAILVNICYDYSVNQQTNDFVQMVSAPLGGSRATIREDANSGTSCSLTTAVNSPTSSDRPLIQFSQVTTETAVESVVTNNKIEALFGNADVYYYSSATGKIIARITNQAIHDYGCTTATVDRAGAGASIFWSNTTSANFIMNKTFYIQPTTNNASGQYQITLYFTSAEKQGWESATGQLWNNIKLIKSPGPISSTNPATTSVEVVTPVFGTLGTNYTLTYTFNSGFSGFGAGIPPSMVLPITLLEFKGLLENTTALLRWSTTTEQNSKRFEIEKSTDGQQFYTIGSVAAAGNSTGIREYSFRDMQLSSANYYRLRMMDLDGRTRQSAVVFLRAATTSQQVWVVNNPINDAIDIRFAIPSSRARVQLVSSNGTVVAEKLLLNPSGQVRWQLNNNLNSGSYILKTTVDGRAFANKLLKQ